MKRIAMPLIALAVVAVALLGGLFTRELINAGTFTTLSPHFAGTCQALTGVPGSEDLVIDRETGVVIVSAGDFRGLWNGTPARGGIHVFDLGDAEPTLIDLTPSAPAVFHPHGLSLHVGADGTRTLMVVNHLTETEHTIEIFRLSYDPAAPGARQARLEHLETVSGPALVSPNDVLAVGPRRFYATNDHAAASGLARSLEELLRQDKANVVYFDGSGFAQVATGLTYPNGIAMTRGGTRVYVTETLDRTLRIYDRDVGSGALTQRPDPDGLVFVGTGVDNIDVDADGNLWIGSHPKILAFSAHARDAANLSPSQVLKVSPAAEGRGGTIDEIYLNLGEEISGVSVAAVHEGRMVLGAVMDPKVLVCTLPDDAGRLEDWQRARQPADETAGEE